jgi:parallel beta-helix repeat protein
MRIVIPSTTAVLAVAAALAWPTAASALSDLVVNVDCASGGRISQALSRPTLFDRRLVVAVSGTCNENVVIERDDVTIRAQSGGGVSAADASKPAIVIDGARRVALEGLSVVGGLHGVQVTGGAAAAIRSSAIRSSARVGVLAERGASVVVDGSTIENHGRVGVSADGASAMITGSTVRGNGLYGVASNRGGSATLGDLDSAGNVCCGNTIENNTFDGVLVAESSSAVLYGNVIQGNGTTTSRFGVLAVRQSSVVLRGGNLVRQNGSATGGGGVFARASTINTGPGDTPVSPPTNEISGNTFGVQGAVNSMVELRGGVSVTGNIFTGVVVDHGSRLRADGGTISGNGAHGIFAGRASSVEFFGGLSAVSGNTAFGLFCADGESSHSGNVVGITGNTAGQVSCTGF